MILLTNIHKATHIKTVKEFKTHTELEDEIKKIKGRHLKTHFIFVNTSSENIAFFKKTYNADFFQVDEEMGSIHLKVLPDGIRRNLVYQKHNIDYDKMFSKLLERIIVDLQKELGAIDFAYEIFNEKINAYDYQIEIKLDDLRIHEKMVISPSVFILFYTDSWSFEFTSIVSTRLEEVFNTINKVFKRRTYATRKARAEKNENNAK